jgi:hypothetical protein
MTEPKVSHRTRALVDITFSCGCNLSYEFEFEFEKRDSIEVNVKVSDGWWVSNLWHPGEVTDHCGQVFPQCKLHVDDAGVWREMFTVKNEMLKKALEYIKELKPISELAKKE